MIDKERDEHNTRLANIDNVFAEDSNPLFDMGVADDNPFAFMDAVVANDPFEEMMNELTGGGIHVRPMMDVE